MEDNKEMDDFMEECLNAAKAQLTENGGVELVTFFRPFNEPKLKPGQNPSGKPAMGMIPYEMIGDKQKWYELIGQAVKQIGVKFTIMVAESWFVTHPEMVDGKPTHMPSEDPSRKECIAIMGIGYDTAGFIMRQTSIMLPFERSGDEIIFLEVKRLGDEEEISSSSTLADVTGRNDLA